MWYLTEMIRITMTGDAAVPSDREAEERGLSAGGIPIPRNASHNVNIFAKYQGDSVGQDDPSNYARDGPHHDADAKARPQSMFAYANNGEQAEADGIKQGQVFSNEVSSHLGAVSGQSAK